MTDLPDVKLKAVLQFPANIDDGTGIDVTKTNGRFRFDLAYDDFTPPLSTIADPTHSVMLIWNTVSQQYGLAPTSLLLGSGSAFPSDAIPIVDGTGAQGVSLLYARGDHVHPSDVPAIATAAEYIANSAPTKMLTPGAPWTAAAPFALTDGATVTPDFALGFDFTWSIGAVGRTLANPSNPKPGQKGMIYLTQGISGATITSWGGFYKFSGGVKPTLSLTAGAIDVISYAVKSATEVECFFAAGMA